MWKIAFIIIIISVDTPPPPEHITVKESINFLPRNLLRKYLPSSFFNLRKLLAFWCADIYVTHSHHLCVSSYIHKPWHQFSFILNHFHSIKVALLLNILIHSSSGDDSVNKRTDDGQFWINSFNISIDWSLTHTMWSKIGVFRYWKNTWVVSYESVIERN